MSPEVPDQGRALLLLKPGLWALRHRLKPAAVLRRLPFIALGALFWAMLYFGTHVVVGFVADIEGLGPMLAARLMSLMFFSLMGFLLLSNLITAISQFYLSSDLQLLRTLPLGEGEILAQKAFYCVLNSSWMVASFTPPILVAFGTASGAGPGYYVSVLLGFVFLMLVSAGAGMAAAHVLTWLFPAGRVRDALLFSGLVMFLVVYLFLRSLVPADIENPIEVVSALIAFKAESPLLPSYWMTRSVAPYLSGRPAGTFYLALLGANAAFCLMAAHSVGRRMLVRNLERLRPSAGRRARPGGGHYPGRGAALIYKDLKLFVRDKGQWSQLLIILALTFVYVYNFKLIPVEAVSGLVPFVRELVVLLNLLLAGMVLSAVAARFVYTSVSAEGMAFWVVQAAPMDMRRFVLGKFALGAVPVTLLTLLIVVVTNVSLGVGRGMMLLTVLTVGVLSVSICALGTGMGALNPRFRHENIASVSMSLGSMFFMLLAFVLVVLTLALLAWPVYLYHSEGGLDLPASLVAGALALGLNFAAAFIPMRMGIRKLSYTILL